MKTNDEGFPIGAKIRVIANVVFTSFITLAAIYGMYMIADLHNHGRIHEAEFYGVEAALVAAIYAVESTLSSGLVLDTIEKRLQLANLNAEINISALKLIGIQNEQAAYQREMIILLLQNPGLV